MGELDSERYSVQLVGERLADVADDVREIKGDVKGLNGRVYELEIAAAKASGRASAAGIGRALTTHRVNLGTAVVAVLGFCVACATALFH